MAFQSPTRFRRKKCTFSPIPRAIVVARPSIVAPSPRDARSSERERETRATEPARAPDARDREDARATTTTTRVGRGSVGDADDDARGRARTTRSDGGRASDGVWIRKARERADGGDQDARGEGEGEDEGGRRGGRRVGVGTREGRVEERRSGNYGSSSHGGHGREMMYDADAAQTFGRQHGSTEVLSALTTEEARTIPARAITVHAGEKSESYVRGADGELYEMMACGKTRTRAHAPSSPRAVVTVHSSEVNEDAGSIGAAGRRYRGSFNSLLLLEAQELSTGRAPTASG